MPTAPATANASPVDEPVPVTLVANPLSELVTKAALAKQLEVSPATLYGWTRIGMPHIKLGAVVLFHAPSVLAWLLERQRSRVADE